MTPSFILQGTGVSGGVAMGRVAVVSHATFDVSQYQIENGKLSAEFARLDVAIKEVRKELETLRAEILSGDYIDDAEAFIGVQETLLNDSSLQENTKTYIAEHGCNVEWALVQQMGLWVAQFDQIEDEYLRERKYDVMQVVERVLKQLMGRRNETAFDHAQDGKIVLFAHDLSPTDLLHCKRSQLAAIVTDQGGVTSHTAIIARSIGVPALVGVRVARQLVRENEWVIVDGNQGSLVVSPGKDAVAEYREHYQAQQNYRNTLKALIKEPAKTRDGTHITLLANMEMPDDLPYIHKANADGVGLFRTEFLYLNHAELPDEDVQFVAYRKVARRMKGQEVILRTIDLGADKIKDKVLSLMRVTQNPALGLRGIRLCFAEQQLFVTQLRAMLRASIFGKLKIMIPMLASADEIHQVLGIIETVKASLRSEGIAFDEDVEIGAMIEVPSAAIVLEPFLKHFSFISVGTNDLIQYVLAVDRDNDSVAHLFNSSHPAILKLLADIFKKADRAGVQVSLCGEMAGNPEMTRLLLGLGLRRFSMPVSALLTVKERILHTDMTEQKKMVQKIMRADDPIKVRALVEKLNSMSPPTKPSR